MSQKKRVRVYQPGQMSNSMNSWFMQMGGMPQQPQQQDMSAQVIQYAQQMIMEGEDPNDVYDDLVNQGVPSQLAAQVIEQLMESMPPQPSYSQPSQEEAMYNQEVEEAEEAVPDYLSLTGFDDDDEDDEDDFKKGGMTKNKFIKEYKKLKLGGQKPDDIPGEQSNDFLGTVQNEANNYKIQKEAEEMYNNPFAVNALSQFVYGGSLPKAQDAGGAGAITQEAFDKYVKEQEERYKQLEQRYNQGYNQGYRNDPYLYGNPYGRGYGNVPTMFNPYGRRSPIIQRSPYLNNFPGADFQGMQLTNFKIDTEKIDRKGLLKFLGPKTKYTWSGEWTRNPATGEVEPKKSATTSTPTTPAAGTTTPAVTNTNDEYEEYKDYVPASTIKDTNYSQDTDIFSTKTTERDIENNDYIDEKGNVVIPEQQMSPEEYYKSQLRLPENPDNEGGLIPYSIVIPETVNSMRQGGYLPKAQIGPPPETMHPKRRTGFDPSSYQQEYQKAIYGETDVDPYYRDYINKIKAGETVTDEERTRANTLFDETLEPMDKKMMGDYNEFMESDPNSMKRKDSIKDATTIDIPAAYDLGMYGARSITGSLDDNRMKRDYLANFMEMAAGPEEFGQRGNYTVNQSANSSNFRPDLDGQIQYSQYGGQFELGEETEMTDEEIEKFLKGGGKLRFV